MPLDSPHSRLSHEEVIRRCLARRFGIFAFPEPLESRFRDQKTDKRNRHFPLAGFLAIVIYNLFFISDRIMVPDISATAWRLRLFVVSPAILLVMGLVTVKRFRRHSEFFIMVLMLLTSSGIIYLLTQSHHPNVAHYYTGIILIAIFGNIVAGIRFKTGLITSSVILFAYVVSLGSMPAMGREAGINSALVLCAALFISLFGCFQLESEARREFLQAMLQRINARKLAETNRKLARISITDGLTNLFNRRHFDTVYDAQWRSAARVSSPISLIFIDIDHFKRFNDHYGHQAGDRCLERVAGAINACVKRAHDLAARYGGEEFVVLLPHTPLDKALIVADLIVRATEKLGIAHEASPTHPFVTLSIGVSCMTPGDSGCPEQLLKFADIAVYRAKESGRNRIVSLDPAKEGDVLLHTAL